MNRRHSSAPLRLYAVALLPVLAFGTKFHVDTKLKLGGGYFSIADPTGCGVTKDRAAYGVVAGEVVLRYGLFLARAQGSLAGGRYLQWTNTSHKNAWAYAPTGIFRLGLDMAYWSLELGVAVSPYVVNYALPSLAARFGPKPIHLLFGWQDQYPMGWYYPLPAGVGSEFAVAILPRLGLGSETEQWSAQLLFLPNAPNVTGSFVWKFGPVGIGAELGFLCLGTTTEDTGSEVVTYGPEDNLAAYLFLVLSYSR